MKKQMTVIAWRFLGNRFVLIAAMVATVIFGGPEAAHAGKVSADRFCKALGMMK